MTLSGSIPIGSSGIANTLLNIFCMIYYLVNLINKKGHTKTPGGSKCGQKSAE